MKTKMVKAVYVTLLVMFLNSSMFAQVSINTDGSQPDNSAILDVSSTTKGMLVPRMTNGEIHAILLPATGLMVFQTDGINGLYYNAGSPATPDWKLVGFNSVNTSTITDNDGDTYITTDEAPSNPDNDAIHFWVKGNITMSLVDNRLEVSSGSDNLFIGDSCGAIETGGGNLYIGTRAGEFANSGTYSVALGSFAGRHNQHNFNTFVGTYSGTNNTTGWNNTFLGFNTGYNNLTGRNNVFIGYESGYNTDAVNNTFIGNQSGLVNTTGKNNVYLGNESGKNNQTGSHNVFIGFRAGINELGSYKLYIGSSETSYPLIYGIFDEQILKFYARRIEINCGDSNVILGSRAGEATTGAYNVFVGDLAGQATTTGLQNVFTGALSGKNNISGNMNVFIGSSAGEYNTTGEMNVFAGSYAGQQNTEGCRNTFIGFNAGISNTTGWRNTYVGLSAGHYNTTGNYNTFLGRAAGFYNIEGGGNVFIGSGAGLNELGSNKLYISNSDVSTPLIYGEFDNSLLKFHGQVQVVDHDVYINNSGNGIILKSPDGTCFRVTVGNDGSLSTTPLLNCP